MSKRLHRRKKKINEDTINRIKKYLKGNRNGSAPREYLDYIMMTEKWKCPPTVYDEQPREVIDLHIRIYGEELRAQSVNAKRQDQKLKK